MLITQLRSCVAACCLTGTFQKFRATYFRIRVTYLQINGTYYLMETTGQQDNNTTKLVFQHFNNSTILHLR